MLIMKSLFTQCILFISIIGILGGCSTDTTPSIESCKAIASELEYGINFSELDSVKSLFNLNIFKKNFREKMVLPKSERAAMDKVMAQAFSNSVETMTTSYGAVNGGNFSLDTVYIDHNKGHAVFSTMGVTGSVNFIDFELEKGKSGNTYITDYLSFYSGFKMQEDLMDFMHKAYSSINRRKRNSSEESYLFAASTLQKAQSQYSEGYCEDAWETYSNINEAYQQDIRFLTWKMKIALCLSTERYLEVADQFIASHELPEKSKAYHRLLMAYHSKDLDAFQKAAIQLQKFVGKNAKLDFLKGDIFAKMKEPEAALNYYNRGFEELNSSFYAHEARLVLLIESNQVTKAVEALMTMNELFAIDSTYLNEVFNLYPQLKDREEVREDINSSLTKDDEINL